jgi:threonine/homoserine/homoserine lactone efflux protein
MVEGRKAGVAAVLGASTVDGIYCALAAFGFSFFVSMLHREQFLIRVIGGVILMGLGMRMLTKTVEEMPVRRTKGLLGAYVSTFLITLANPAPLVVFSAAFTAIGIHHFKQMKLAAALLVVGVFVGSGLWALILISPISSFRNRCGKGLLPVINKLPGAIVTLFGLVITVKTLTTR